MLKSFSALSLATRGASLATHGKPIIAVSKIGPYSLFLKENASKHSGKITKTSIADFANETAAKWKGLSEPEKKSYAKRAKEINDKAIAAFLKKPESEQQMLETAARDAKEKLAKKRERRERRENWEKTGHPKKPTSAYNLFIKEKMAGAKPTNKEEATSRITALAKEWSGLADSVKAKYVKVADAEAATYKIELEKWRKSNPEKILAAMKDATPSKAATPMKAATPKKAM